MGLRFREFPGQSSTFNFVSWKSFSLFQVKDTGQDPITIFFYQEMHPSHIWNGFSFNYLNVFVEIHHTLI